MLPRTASATSALDPWAQPIRLGSAEAALRGIGLAIWLFVGWAATQTPAGASGTARWWGPWLAYGAVIVAVGLHRLPAQASVALLVLQAGSVAAAADLGLQGHEGLLLSLVAVQVPMVLSLRAAVGWTLAQLPLLVSIVWAFKRPTEVAEILGAYSAFCAFALLVYYLHQREWMARRALAQANADLVATRALVIDGALQGERLRIARDLHDSLGHHLTALGLQLDIGERLSPGAAAEPVALARSINQRALTEVRQVVHQLQSDDGLDLVAAIEALADGLPGVAIQVIADDAARAVDAATRHELFRCVQEALTNSLRHGHAPRVWVELRAEGDSLQVRVRDDGHGGVPASTGTGLASIRARVARLGGAVDFHSEPVGGFTVHITVPRREPA